MDILNEKIHLSEYDANWTSQFAEEKIILQNHLPDAHIEHVGSTAIEGMVSKPVIDILIGVDSGASLDEIAAILEGLGYTDLSEASGMKASGVFRLWLAKRGTVNNNLHVVEYLDDIWKKRIAFRNYLRENKEDALRYAEIKQSFVSKGIDTVLEFANEKGPFISEIHKKCNWESIS
jgi:GrpB-like predicted nucleotidyltransferase (UPF0157 family)